MQKISFSDYAWFLLGLGALLIFYPTINEVINNLGASYYWYSIYLGYVFGFAIFYTRFKSGYRLYGKQGAINCGLLLLGSIGFPLLLLGFSTDIWKHDKIIAWGITALSFLTIAASGYTKLKVEKAVDTHEEKAA